MNKIGLALLFAAALFTDGCGYLKSHANQVDRDVDNSPLLSAPPRAAFRDAALERQWTQVFQRKIDDFSSRPGGFKVSYVYAAGPWNFSTKAADIKDANGNVIGTSKQRIPDYKSIIVWVIGTAAGSCGVFDFGLRYDHNGAQYSREPDAIFTVGAGVGRIPCRR